MPKQLIQCCLHVVLLLVFSLQVAAAGPSKPAPGGDEAITTRTAGGFDLGNAWYDPTKVYAKLRVWENGVYRVTANELSAISFPTAGFSFNNLHLIYRGVEVPIHVVANGSSLQYIEFFGLRNDGRVDSTMYRNPYSGIHDGDQQPNKNLSLFSDTSAYYLTYDQNPGLRFQTFNDQNYQNYSPEQFFRYESRHEYHPATGGQSVDWNNGGGSQYDIFHILNSYYITGEGYVGRGFGFGNEATIAIPTPHAANLGNPSDYSCRIYGRSSWQHDLQVTLDNNVVLRDTTNNVYVRTRNTTYNQPLGTQVRAVYTALGSQNNNTDNNNYCWATLTYDRLFNMDGKNAIMMKSWRDPGNSYFRFENGIGTTAAWAWDLTNGVICTGQVTNDTVRIVAPGATNPRNIYVVTDDGVRSALVERPALADLKNPNGGAKMVIITHRSLTASAQAYKNYRDTCTFNQIDTRIVYTDEIYDEFGYGTITPLAIKRFCKYAIDNWIEKPEFFLLWGKGQYQTRGHANNKVPTYGYPACDYDFVSDYDPSTTDVVPEAAIGRVNIYTNEEGFSYLDKVNDYEHTVWDPWMKEVVFLGGGDDTTEQKPILDAFLANYTPYIVAPPLGGNASYYQKFNTGIVTNSNMTSTQRINAGTSIIHFFGHSSNNIYDVDIQEPVLYQNWGKYPLMIAFGCYGGNYTGDNKSFGERFVLEPGRGSIGYLANSTAGYLTPLKNFGISFYPALYSTHFGQPIGKVLQATLQDYGTSWGDQVHINHAKQVNLQGDPSIVIYYPKKPDLEITDRDVYFSPSGYSASDSSFTMHVTTRNLALVGQDSFFLSVRQQLPSGVWVDYPKTKHPPVVREDTLLFPILNTYGQQMAGLNNFDIFVDSTDILDEYRENNNRLLFQELIPGNVPAILFPYNYAVVDRDNITLSAASFVINRKQKVRYIYEMDTVITFNSPFLKRSGVVEGTTIFSEWSPSVTLTDSMVYYWRVRLADVNPAAWAQASFKYIVNKVGWAQSRPPQFFEDATWQMEMDRVNYEWAFAQRSVELHAFVNQLGHGNYRLANGAFSNVVPSGNSLRGIMYTPIRARDLAPTITGTSNGDWVYASMPDAEGDVLQALAGLPEGDYFLAVSEGNPKVPTWSNDFVKAFHMIGCDTSKIRDIPNNNSFIIFGRKGYPGQGIVISEPNIYDELSNIYKFDLRLAMNTNQEEGIVTSTPVGPAQSWNELIWDWESVDQMPLEDANVSLYAVRPDQTDSLVLDNVTRGTYNLGNVDADRFPYMRLRAHVEDSIRLTAPQLDNWHVLYSPAADVAIDPITDWSFQRDTIMEGETLRVTCSARNVSGTDFDSLLVKFTVQWPDRSSQEVGRVRYGAIAAGDLMSFTYDLPTAGRNMVGDLNFAIELNPDNDQAELYHFNNLYSYPFHVLPDVINPILDVTVDGKHLMDGDIISPMPEILFEINDENPFLAVGDSAYEIFFGPKTPNPANLPRVFIDGNSEMESVPAVLPDNKGRLYFRPGRLQDGEYTLRVQGYDATGNASGKTEYEINFEVVNESAVSNVLNYPNPFSTSTRWVYTLTGSEIPEVFEIQIFTITGRLVKVIDLHETNDVKYGRNISDYAWDGRDEFGDLLANGVYVYKVVAKLSGQTMETRDEGVTDMFRNGFGKLYIMR